MAIQLEIQIQVPDDDREKLLLLLKQAMEDVEDYYKDNPELSPDLTISHPQDGVGQVDLVYQVV